MSGKPVTIKMARSKLEKFYDMRGRNTLLGKKHPVNIEVKFFHRVLFLIQIDKHIEEVETVILNIDEFETVRLADYEELYFEDAAEKMDVSRQTFGNILKSAHKKIAEALINGKTLKIEGGDIELLKDKEFYCKRCRKRVENSEKCKNCFEEKE